VFLIPFINVIAFMAMTIFGSGMILSYAEHRKVFAR